MRIPLFCIALMIGGCGRGESRVITLEKDKVARVGICHVLLDHARADGETRRAFLRTVCGAPESALNEKQWWGNAPEPMMFSVDVGDCMLLESEYYCLENIENGQSAEFRASYKRPHSSGSVIERIK